MAKAIAFGTFDGFHPGHKFYLDESAKHGALTVVVSRDATVLKIKGRPPLRHENERLEAVRAAGFEARLGSEGDKYAVIEEVRPDVVCLGYDQEAFTERLDAVLKERGVPAEIVRIGSFEPEKYKSSILNRRDDPLAEPPGMGQGA